MTYWIITDTHFGHVKMQEYCGRPEGFENKIIHNLMMMCKLRDVLIHLGDICIGNDERWHESLSNVHAKKWLVRGNHDKKSAGWYLNHGWDCVSDSLMLNVFGERILFSHRPAECGDCSMNIHGHMHNVEHHPEMIPRITPKQRLVIMEHHYSPISLRRIMENK